MWTVTPLKKKKEESSMIFICVPVTNGTRLQTANTE
jgi:hypothetical protein